MQSLRAVRLCALRRFSPQLAAAKNEIEAGSISNGTIRLVTLSTNYAPMLNFPKQGYHAWRKVDWGLFGKLRPELK